MRMSMSTQWVVDLGGKKSWSPDIKHRNVELN